MPFRYEYLNGPDKIFNNEQALREGLNCIALMHLLLKQLFSTKIPNNVRGWEMFCDNPYLENISSSENMQKGDIIFFGRKELPDYALAFKPEYNEKGRLMNAEYGNQLINDQYAGVHLAMFTGEKDVNGDPLFIHANKIEGKVSVWSLHKFLSFEQYSTIHGIKRLKIKTPYSIEH